MPKLLLLRGLPGSGKSTYAASLLKRGSNWKRFNKDTLREMLDLSDWSRENEAALNAAMFQMIQFYLRRGFDVVSDNMNLDPSNVRRLLRDVWLEVGPVEVEFLEFNTPLEVCIARDALRPKPIGESTIRGIAERWMASGKMPEVGDWKKSSDVA